MLKRYDKLIIFVVLGIAMMLSIAFHFVLGNEGDEMWIVIDGQRYGSYSLQTNQTIRVDNENGCNEIVIESGQVYMKYADCPDQYCVEHKSISKMNETIVCLPHKLVVEIHLKRNETSIDGVSR